MDDLRESYAKAHSQKKSGVNRVGTSLKSNQMKRAACGNLNGNVKKRADNFKSGF